MRFSGGDKKSMGMRLDKWLWAARFFKTRSLAHAAIEGGKVACEGIRAKPSKEIEVGMVLSIRQGLELKIVQVKALSTQRKGGAAAQLLYEESAESLEKRAELAEQRRLAPVLSPEQGRPNKQDRRRIIRFKQERGC